MKKLNLFGEIEEIRIEKEMDETRSVREDNEVDFLATRTADAILDNVRLENSIARTYREYEEKLCQIIREVSRIYYNMFENTRNPVIKSLYTFDFSLYYRVYTEDLLSLYPKNAGIIVDMNDLTCELSVCYRKWDGIKPFWEDAFRVAVSGKRSKEGTNKFVPSKNRELSVLQKTLYHDLNCVMYLIQNDSLAEYSKYSAFNVNFTDVNPDFADSLEKLDSKYLVYFEKVFHAYMLRLEDLRKVLMPGGRYDPNPFIAHVENVLM